jgi:chromosome segregation ATPase
MAKEDLKAKLAAVTKERDAYKKAKQENDDRFMGERDTARAELAEHKAWAEEELANAQRQANAAVEDMKLQLSEAKAMLQQKLSPAETCREERAEGNGGCGTCSICCNELKAELFEVKMKLKGVQASVGVLQEVQQERERQNAKWGIQDHPDGTCEGPGGAKAARQHADAAKSICNQFAKVKQVTWSHILTEEMMEAYAETEPVKLRTELIQVAAVATQWVECIDRRQRGRTG